MLKQQIQQKGFTLVELMVSLTIFSIVMTVSSGTLLVLIDMNAKAQALYSATTNVSFALDSLTREIRTGYRYVCDTSDNTSSQSLPSESTKQDCLSSNPGDFIAFIREEDGARMGYRLNGNTGIIEQKVGTGAWQAITADDVLVDRFEVVVDNTSFSDDKQPVVSIMVSGYVNNGLENNTDFFIQSRIVQRRLDII